MTNGTEKRQVIVRLAEPRGFCAGVERAIKTVEDALALHGAPVYVRHEIVHNTHVVARLRAMGAVFVDEVSAAPADRPVVISAHGAPRAVFEDANSRDAVMIDATCPLVLKVHAQTRRYHAKGAHILLVGHAGHPEVVGTLGQAAEGAVTLVETRADVEALPEFSGPLAYATQTTLSVTETADIIAALKDRFPDIEGPAREDICYATTNRQNAVRAAAKDCDLFVVIGSQTSSNSQRLVETALECGARHAMLVEDAADFDWTRMSDVRRIGLSAGASAPETLVEGFIEALAQLRTIIIERIKVADEDISFKSPIRLAG